MQFRTSVLRVRDHNTQTTVLLDSRPLVGATGIARYARTLIRVLPDFDSSRAYRTFNWRSRTRDLSDAAIPVVSSRLPGSVLARLSQRGVPAPRWGLGRVSVFHGTSYDVPRLRRVRTIMTCHDVAFLHVPDTYPPGVAEDFDAGLRRAIRYVDAIAVDSFHAREDLITHFDVEPDRVRVLYPAVVQGTGHSLYLPIARPTGLVPGGRPYFLVVGEMNPRKNLLRIVDAFAGIAGDTDHQLMFVGPPGPDGYLDTVRQRVSSLSLTDRVLFPGRVNDERLAFLYDGSTALVCCSQYEGFGYPVAEAASRGIPIVASNVASLPEIAGSAAIYADPGSTESIADALRRVSMDTLLRAALSAAGPREASRFTVEALIRSVISLYADLGV